MGVGFRAAIVDAKGNVSFDEKVSLYTTWVKELRLSGSTTKLMCSLDFTYTSHRTARPTTLAGRGRKTSVYSSKSRYTNCIITGVLSDGRQLDSILYTYNPSFRTDRPETALRKRQYEELSKHHRKYSVKKNRVVYDGKLTGETRTFVREYDDMVRDFLEYHKEKLQAQEIVYLSDNGSAFYSANGSVVEQLGYGKHTFYPACVHQFMSPNDNKLHGAAKAKWRSMFTCFDDDVKCSIALLKCLDDISRDSIRSWWVENLFLEGGIVRKEHVKSVISGSQSKWSSLHEICVDDYFVWSSLEEGDIQDQNSTARRRLSSSDGACSTKKSRRQ